MACCENVRCNPHRYDPPSCVGPDDRSNRFADPLPGTGTRVGMVDLKLKRKVVEVATGDPAWPTVRRWVPLND